MNLSLGEVNFFTSVFPRVVSPPFLRESACCRLVGRLAAKSSPTRSAHYWIRDWNFLLAFFAAIRRGESDHYLTNAPSGARRINKQFLGVLSGFYYLSSYDVILLIGRVIQVYDGDPLNVVLE